MCYAGGGRSVVKKMGRGHAPRFALPALALGAAVLALALALANGCFGNLNQDEGWYLHAALEQAAGRRPYRDFFFTQGPVMPAVYGLLAPLWADHGVAGGRALTALLGLVAGLLTARLAASAAPRDRRFPAALSAFLLTSGNVHHSYFTVIPKTYALASLLLTGGLLLLARAGRRGAAWQAAPAGLLLAAAAGTRLSLGLAMPVAGIRLLARTRRPSSAWLWFGAAGLAGLALVFGPPLLTAAEPFVFANFFHVTRTPGDLLLPAGSLSRLARAYLPLLGVAMAALAMAAAARITRPRRAPPAAGTPDGPAFWLAIWAPIFLLHLLSPCPYDDYQTPIMPLLAAAVAALFWRWLPRPRDACRETPLQAALLAVLLAWSTLCAGASPINQEWFVIRQDRFWIVRKQQPDLALLRQTGRWIRERLPEGRPLLTQDVYLAVEARRRVPPGFEMGPFGYFPELDDDKAARCHVLNRAGLRAALTAGEAPLAAFSGYGLAIAAPALTPLPPQERAALTALLETRYRQVRTVPDFGQGHTTLTIWELE